MGKGDHRRPGDTAAFRAGIDRVFGGEEPARKGDWIQTATGRSFYPLDPRVDEICIEDIAHALSNICRYGGHCQPFYSVAQHSVFVSHLVPEEDALWGLLHDAGEAYLGDMVRPLKHSAWGRNFREAEDHLLTIIARRFNLPGTSAPESVNVADNQILVTEVRDLMGGPNVQRVLDAFPGVEPLPFTVIPRDPGIAVHLFMDRFEELYSEENT